MNNTNNPNIWNLAEYKNCPWCERDFYWVCCIPDCPEKKKALERELARDEESIKRGPSSAYGKPAKKVRFSEPNKTNEADFAFTELLSLSDFKPLFG